MFTEGFSFPHPVLGLDDDINGEFNCSFKLKRNAVQKSLVFHDISYEITNDYINELVNTSNAKFVIKIYCSSTYKTWTIIDPNQSFEIDEDDLINKAELSVFVVASENIPIYQDVSFNSDFTGHSFVVNKNEVLAVTGDISIRIPKADEELGLGNIFKFFAHEKDKPMEFTYHQNKIHIMYPVDINEGHPPNNLFKRSPWTAYNIFIIPAITGAFQFVDQNEDEAEGYDWFTTIKTIFPEDKWKKDPFINAQMMIGEVLPILRAHRELIKQLKL